MTTRPDILDLIGPDFDRQNDEPAKRTLLICAAPRSGSYELCRLLVAAGIGVPHEYFNPNYARRLAARWGLTGDPLGENLFGPYIETLRRRRSAGDVFATKINYQQFEACLRNRHGAALFDGAVVVHLFRPDAAAQYESMRASLETGRWDFSSNQTTEPIPLDPEKRFAQILSEVDALFSQDGRFRALFVLLGIWPIFVLSKTLFAEPAAVIQKIAEKLEVPVNAIELKRMIAAGGSYARGGIKKAVLDDTALRTALRRLVFEPPNLEPDSPIPPDPIRSFGWIVGRLKRRIVQKTSS